MTHVRTLLKDSPSARWIALGLISITMFFAYFFVDIVAPIKTLLTDSTGMYGWSSVQYGALGGSEFFLNVFALFLILSGIILDRMGIRFTIMTAGIAMVVGGALKYYALSAAFQGSVLYEFLDSFMVGVPPTLKLACTGFAIFGIGVEMAGITVSKTIVKWFRGKELALAMGIEMAIARLGVFAVFQLSPIFARSGGVENTLFWGLAFLCVGLLLFFMYTFMDRRLDRESKEAAQLEPEDPFRISDIGKIFSNPGFLAIAGLCVLFYSAIFPFQKFAAEMLSVRLSIPLEQASRYFSFFPIGAAALTPFIGYFLDTRGKGATLMFFGALLMTVVHFTFGMVPQGVLNVWMTIVLIVILGTAFSLVPAAMWPSLPKIVEDRYLGSAYGCIFWIQNIGLMLVPLLIGFVLDVSQGYFWPQMIFAGFGVAAMFLSLLLVRIDRKKKYGLDLPNKK